jgi:hypothetical protein
MGGICYNFALRNQEQHLKQRKEIINKLKTYTIMKKFNLFAVAFVAVFTQSVIANAANEAIGANIGSEDNAVRIIEEARPEAAPRGIFVLTKEARPEAAPRGIFVLTDKARPEAAPRGARPEMAPRGAEIGKGFRGFEVGMASAPRGAEVDKGFRGVEIGRGFRGAEVGRGFRGAEVGRGFRGVEIGRGFRGAETGMAPATHNAEMGKGMAWPMV